MGLSVVLVCVERDAGHNTMLGLGMGGVWGLGPVGRVGSGEGA